jgi:hypothetical protein
VGGLRQQFHYVTNIMPTILEAAGIQAPDSINGVKQLPIDGTSMVYTWDDVKAPSPQPLSRDSGVKRANCPELQFGQCGKLLYQEGRRPCGDHAPEIKHQIAQAETTLAQNQATLIRPQANRDLANVTWGRDRTLV